MGTMGQIHLFLSCRDPTTPSGNEHFHLFPIVSKLFHSALLTSRKGSSTATQAIRNAFFVAHKVANERSWDNGSGACCKRILRLS